MKSVKAGISVERVTNDAKPIPIKNFGNLLKFPAVRSFSLPFVVLTIWTAQHASSGVSGWS
jgi:hypothetical protein